MDVALVIDVFNDVFGVILPVYVIVLVVKRTPGQHVKVYSRMLIASCALDLLYAITNIVSMFTMVYAEKKIFAIVRNRYIWFNHTLVTFALLSHIYCIFISVILIPIQFMYRYKVVTSSTTSYSVVVRPLFLSALYLLGHVVLLPITFQPTSDKYDQLLRNIGIEMYAGYPYYVADADVEKWLNLHLLNSVLIVSVAYVFTYIYYRKTKKYLQTFQESVYPATLRAQRQVELVLVLQALYPMVFLGIPAIIGNLVPLLGINSPTLGNVLTCTVHTTPVLNALSIIICVPSYRRATLKCLYGFFKCKFDECNKVSDIRSSSDKDNHRRSTTGG